MQGIWRPWKTVKRDGHYQQLRYGQECCVVVDLRPNAILLKKNGFIEYKIMAAARNVYKMNVIDVFSAKA
jgi:hypothetical protein